MAAASLESVLRRDRLVVGASLAALTALSWVYLAWLAQTMNTAAAVPGSVMAPGLAPWGATRFAFMFVMWAVMMVGMMLPSAAPMILLYALVGRQAQQSGKALAPTGVFAAGYLLAWTVFSLAATLAQWGLERCLLLSPMMVSNSRILGGLLLLAAGAYQWTPAKDACLSHCRAPLHFIQAHGGFRRDAFGSLELGFKHGLYCVGCCWALMALLFVGGVMNLLWIAAIAIFVLAEKLLPASRLIPRTAGSVLVVAGAYLLVSALG